MAESHPNGFYPAYYAATPEKFALGLMISAVGGSLGQPRIDGTALGVFLQTGFTFRDQTVIEGILTIPEGGVLSWTPGAAVRKSNRRASKIAHSMSWSSAVEGFVETFEAAIGRSAGERIMLLLSGGRDSRHITAELVRQKRKIENALTLRVPWLRRNHDHVIVAQAARRFGIPHK